MLSAWLALVFLLLNLEVVGQEGARRTPSTPASSTAERIHLGDIVDVDVVGSLEFDWRGGLNNEGFLDGFDKASKPVFALCRTEAELAEAIRADYQRILRTPVVVVTIIDRSNRALSYVHGAVRQPHRFQLRRPATLSELIVLSGGITDRSSGEISIFRPPNVSCGDGSLTDAEPRVEAPKLIKIKIADMLMGSPEADPSVLSGDIINVIENFPVFVISGNNAPVRLNLTPGITLSRALESAIGPVVVRRAASVRIYRRKGANTMFEAEIRAVTTGAAEDIRLEPFDVIEVASKGAPRRRIVDTAEAGVLSEPLGRLPLRILD